MRSVVNVLLVLALGLSAGCATVGKDFDTTHVKDIVNEETTKPQVRAWFGAPHQTIRPLQDHPAGGVERWQYTHAYSVAGGSTTSKALVVDFNVEDIVVDNAYSETNQ